MHGAWLCPASPRRAGVSWLRYSRLRACPGDPTAQRRDCQCRERGRRSRGSSARRSSRGTATAAPATIIAAGSSVGRMSSTSSSAASASPQKAGSFTGERGFGRRPCERRLRLRPRAVKSAEPGLRPAPGSRPRRRRAPAGPRRGPRRAGCRARPELVVVEVGELADLGARGRRCGACRPRRSSRPVRRRARAHEPVRDRCGSDRCARPGHGLVLDGGFHQRSYSTTWFAAVRLRPVPPAFMTATAPDRRHLEVGDGPVARAPGRRGNCDFGSVRAERCSARRMPHSRSA